LSAGRFPNELRPGGKRRPYTPYGDRRHHPKSAAGWMNTAGAAATRPIEDDILFVNNGTQLVSMSLL
jgi:hypothetical protein